MKMAVHDWEEHVMVKTSKKTKIKKVNHSICGPHGQDWKQTSRVCQHGYVNPADWPFCDIKSMSNREIDQYLCPHGCFKIKITLGR